MPAVIDFRTKRAGEKTKYGVVTQCPVCWKLAAMSQPKPSNGLTLYAHEITLQLCEGLGHKVTSFHLVDAQEMPVLLEKEAESISPRSGVRVLSAHVEDGQCPRCGEMEHGGKCKVQARVTGSVMMQEVAVGPTSKRKEARTMQKKAATKKATAKSDSGLQAIRDLMTKAAAKVKTDKKGAIALFKKVASQKSFPRKAFRAREALQKLGVTVTA